MRLRRLFCVIFMLILFHGITPCAAADTFEERLSVKSGAAALSQELDEETQGRVAQLETDGWLSVVSGLLREKLTAPLQTLFCLTGVILLCALSSCFDFGQASGAISLSGAVAAALLLGSPLLSLLESAVRTIQTALVFLSAAVPVYAALLVASGSPTAGGTYSTLVLLLGNAVPVLVKMLVFPLLRLFLVLSVASALTTAKLTALTDSLYSFMKWALALSVSVFSGVLSVQTTLNAQVDAAAGKAVKLMTSTAVPIVGGAIGDAAAAITNSVGVVKSGAGAFGILAVLCVFLPTVVEVILWSLCCAATQLAADLLGAPKLSVLCRQCGGAAKMLLAVLAAVCAVSVVSAALVLYVGG